MSTALIPRHGLILLLTLLTCLAAACSSEAPVDTPGEDSVKWYNLDPLLLGMETRPHLIAAHEESFVAVGSDPVSGAPLSWFSSNGVSWPRGDLAAVSAREASATSVFAISGQGQRVVALGEIPSITAPGSYNAVLYETRDGRHWVTLPGPGVDFRMAGPSSFGYPSVAVDGDRTVIVWDEQVWVRGPSGDWGAPEVRLREGCLPVGVRPGSEPAVLVSCSGDGPSTSQVAAFDDSREVIQSKGGTLPQNMLNGAVFSGEDVTAIGWQLLPTTTSTSSQDESSLGVESGQPVEATYSRSDNGGASWSTSAKFPIPSEISSRDIRVLDIAQLEDTLIAVGSSKNLGDLPVTTVWVSADGGATWQAEAPAYGMAGDAVQSVARHGDRTIAIVAEAHQGSFMLTDYEVSSAAPATASSTLTIESATPTGMPQVWSGPVDPGGKELTVNLTGAFSKGELAGDLVVDSPYGCRGQLIWRGPQTLTVKVQSPGENGWCPDQLTLGEASPDGTQRKVSGSDGLSGTLTYEGTQQSGSD
ncbi:hypothetical protein [Kineosporia sp. NBRC 101731]|uniref:hypothetical protein n=1 Tax=Kineosporia sp. NBRC 101731 TaxID=3032199 RepID=UPI0024A2B454|nr:hypothetical protein [Kineosporia sp. NBRC 101731]GLY29865.1 hypothetical protein Kisp02_32300 [Kineosporia sp. NBRC 101731]